MKSKALSAILLLAIIATTSLSSCKSRCHCPTFGKQVPKSQIHIMAS